MKALLRIEDLVLLILLQVYSAQTEQITLIVPNDPVAAQVGENVLLPCQLSPNVSAVQLEVKWLKRDDSQLIHTYVNGADLEGKHSPGYRGRTRLFKEELGTGNVSLQLSNVKVSDKGIYECYVVSSTWFTDSQINLKVTGLGSSPRITLLGRQDSDVSLLCESEGWFPKPELHWRNVKDADLTGRAVLTEKQGTGGLFTLQSALQISQREADGIICLIRQGEEKRILQTRVHISGEFFTLVSSSWKSFSVFFIVFLVLVGLCIPVAVYYSRKKINETVELAKRDLKTECDDLRKQIKDTGHLLKSEWEKLQENSVAVTLDPDTAHCCLTVSEDGKRVRNEMTEQDVPDNKQRFDEYYFVLGREGFTSGRHYWEVDVGDRDSWKLGVTYESAERKGHFDLNPSEGYWVIQLRSGGVLCALNVPLLKNLQKVGVYLDYEEGKVSFYRVEDYFHIHTFTDKFSGKLYPFFDPGTGGMDLVILSTIKDGSNNSAQPKADHASIPV
ncbi:butyrophilin subfamily 1 member A1-like [Acipenser oxyrinchus oxyrinchus]|uniref:Butyrophilin subfamily 1 member A1-like n=1 Tax=Acipenser oxyrinchus oxyrinchus TaxID=40147 RepID=A0AAD8FTQ5_ACIOX|nr:butyrophilin subfamily 1 member A1-like [Acipenser oxyrinchus oxyrinchus]